MLDNGTIDRPGRLPEGPGRVQTARLPPRRRRPATPLYAPGSAPGNPGEPA
jgi:hypothetical protein